VVLRDGKVLLPVSCGEPATSVFLQFVATLTQQDR
jgi:hypothetical protein